MPRNPPTQVLQNNNHYLHIHHVQGNVAVAARQPTIVFFPSKAYIAVAAMQPTIILLSKASIAVAARQPAVTCSLPPQA